MNTPVKQHERNFSTRKSGPPSSDCPCQSGRSFESCCQPFVSLKSLPGTAEQLMRSRYTAYILQDSKYLLHSWHPDFKPVAVKFSPEPQHWIGLKILSTHLGGENDRDGQVHFIARYKINGKAYKLEENSRFKKIAGQWLYQRGDD